MTVVFRHQRQTDARTWSAGDQFVGADVNRTPIGTCITVDICRHAGINACINCIATGSDMVVSAVRVHKARIAPNIDRTGEDGASTAPIDLVGPGARTPERGLQRGRAAVRDHEAHRVAGQDGVGQRYTARSSLILGHIDPAVSLATVAGKGGVQQPGGRAHDIQPTACQIGLVVCDHVVRQCDPGITIQPVRRVKPMPSVS